jgi:hypothetical protein
MRPVVLLALAVVAAFVAVAPATAHRSPDITITAFARNSERKVHDLGELGASQGDVRVVTNELYNRRGQRIGRGSISCVIVEHADDPGEQVLANCTVTFRFAGGELFGGGLVDFEAFHEHATRPGLDVNAITGGTGVYEGVYGTATYAGGRTVIHLHRR